LSDSARDSPTRDSIWVEALRSVAGVARKTASSEDEFIRTVTEEFRRLHLRGGVGIITPDGMLQIQNWSISRSIEKSLKRLTGLEITGYGFDPNEVDLYSTALSTKKAVFSDDRAQVIAQLTPVAFRPLVPRFLRLLGNENIIVAPLIVNDKPIGTINVAAKWLTPEDSPIVDALADNIAIALDQVRNRIKLEKALEFQRLRNQIAETLARNLELPIIMDKVLRLSAELTGADSGALGLAQPNATTLTFSAYFGFPDEKMVHVTGMGDWQIWDPIRDEEPILVDELAAHPQSHEDAIRSGIHALMGLPLLVGNTVIGVLGLFNHSPGFVFSYDQLEQMEAIASMAAIAIYNAQLFSAAKRSAEESQVLIRTARTISESLDTDTVLNEIATQANGLLQADGSRIHLVDPEQGLVRCVVALEPNAKEISAFEFMVGEGLTGKVIETGKPLIVNDPVSDPRSVQVPGTPEDEDECLAIVPLSIRQRTMGSMTVRRLGLDRPFSLEELDLLMAFAAHAAVSIENAHLFGQIEAQAQKLEEEVIERTHELALSESKYRGLVETAQAGIFQLNTEGVVVYANQALSDMIEIPLDEILNRPFADAGVLTVDQIEDNLRNFARRIRGDLPTQQSFEMEIRSRSGRKIPVLVGVSLFTDEAGNTRGLTGLLTDISDRITLEQALESERDRLNALLTNIGDSVMVTNAEGLLQFVNPAWERQTGYSAEDVIGKDPSFLRGRHFDQLQYADILSTLQDMRTWHGEVINVRRDGSEYEAEITITPVFEPSTEMTDYVTVMHDISALKELDRMKSQFVSDVSHELRTPLTNIRLYLDLLDRIKDEDKVARYLVTLSRESERLSNLIDDLLSLSRLDVGTTLIEPTAVDVNELLSSLVHDRESLAKRQGLDLHLDLEEALPAVIGDERLLGQVFTNLLTNAMNYTLEGGEISIYTHAEERDGWEGIVVDVQDTGLGIPIDEQTEIFKRFYRGRSSRKTGASGTGLGLAICEEIVGRHNGTISVSSEGVPGEGSLFSIWLPSTLVPQASPEKLNSSSQPPA
jgi:PAS domain S-box-containing protein